MEKKIRTFQFRDENYTQLFIGKYAALLRAVTGELDWVPPPNADDYLTEEFDVLALACWVFNFPKLIDRYEKGEKNVFPLPYVEVQDLEVFDLNFDLVKYRQAETYYLTHRRTTSTSFVVGVSQSNLLDVSEVVNRCDNVYLSAMVNECDFESEIQSSYLPVHEQLTCDMHVMLSQHKLEDYPVALYNPVRDPLVPPIYCVLFGKANKKIFEEICDDEEFGLQFIDPKKCSMNEDDSVEVQIDSVRRTYPDLPVIVVMSTSVHLTKPIGESYVTSTMDLSKVLTSKSLEYFADHMGFSEEVVHLLTKYIKVLEFKKNKQRLFPFVVHNNYGNLVSIDIPYKNVKICYEIGISFRGDKNIIKLKDHDYAKIDLDDSPTWSWESCVRMNSSSMMVEDMSKDDIERYSEIPYLFRRVLQSIELQVGIDRMFMSPDFIGKTCLKSFDFSQERYSERDPWIFKEWSSDIEDHHYEWFAENWNLSVQRRHALNNYPIHRWVWFDFKYYDRDNLCLRVSSFRKWLSVHFNFDLDAKIDFNISDCFTKGKIREDLCFWVSSFQKWLSLHFNFDLNVKIKLNVSDYVARGKID